MSTVTTTPHHSFPTTFALAAASAVLGGLAVYGISAAQDDATTPSHAQTSTSTTTNRQCPDNRCLPPSQRGGSHNSRSIEQTLKGGHTMPGMP